MQGIIPDPVVFLEEAEEAGLGQLLGNPQTLDLRARSWGTDKKPRNKFEVYEIGVSELLKEINPQHVAHGVTSVDRRDLRERGRRSRLHGAFPIKSCALPQG